jgi:phospholipid/cholesterol/gamma-HCH transport system substrate-binding protein
MFSLSSEAKVGLFVLVGLIILGYMSFKVGQQTFGMRGGYSVQVAFDNAEGLDKDAYVNVAGVEVGRVEAIELKDGKALLTLRIFSGVKLEKDVKAAIKTHGIMGDKYVEIIPGTKGREYLEENGRISQIERQVDLERLINQLSLIADDIKKVTGSMSRVLGSEKGEASLQQILDNTRQLTYNINAVVKSNQENLRAMLENTRQLTENLNRLVSNSDGKFIQMIDNLKNASGEMEKTFASLREVSESINKGEGSLGKLIKDKTTIDNLNKTLASLEEVAEKINQGKGTLGKLVNDDETAKNLNESLSGISRYVNKAEQFRTFLGYKGEYLFDKSNFKSYLDIKIQPKEDKFYILGVVSDPRGRHSIKDTTINGATTHTEEWDKDKLLFNAMIGKRFKNLVFRGGLLESTGGFGVDYLTLNDKLKLTFEAFDFSSDRRTHLKAAAEYQLLKHLYLNAGWDDFISDQENSSPFAGFSIRFEDDDLKYLLTTTPIPK